VEPYLVDGIRYEVDALEQSCEHHRQLFKVFADQTKLFELSSEVDSAIEYRVSTGSFK
jgi:hypothetical protein